MALRREYPLEEDGITGGVAMMERVVSAGRPATLSLAGTAFVAVLAGCYIGEERPRAWDNHFGYARLTAIPVARFGSGVKDVTPGHGFAVAGAPLMVVGAPVLYPVGLALYYDSRNEDGERQSFAETHNEALHVLVTQGETVRVGKRTLDVYMDFGIEEIVHQDSIDDTAVTWTGGWFGIGVARTRQTALRPSIALGYCSGYLSFENRVFPSGRSWLHLRGPFVRGGIELLPAPRGDTGRPRAFGIGVFLSLSVLYGDDLEDSYVAMRQISTSFTFYW